MSSALALAACGQGKQNHLGLQPELQQIMAVAHDGLRKVFEIVILGRRQHMS